MANNKNMLTVLLAAVMLLYAHVAHAQLSLTKQADLSFGTIDFDHPTAVGNITLATNGTITYGTNTSGSGLGTPGQLQLDGPAGTTVTIACDAGSLALPGSTDLPITPVSFVVGSTNVGAYAFGTTCAGIDTSVASHTLTATTSENTIFIGGLLAINGVTLTNGTYRGTNFGGTQPSFRILVQ